MVSITEPPLSPAFQTISQIIKNDCAIAIDVKYELEAIDVARSDLRRDIHKYKQRLKQRYTKSLRSDVIEERLKPSYIELRTIISGGLAKLMNIRAKIRCDGIVSGFIKILPVELISDLLSYKATSGLVKHLRSSYVRPYEAASCPLKLLLAFETYFRSY